MKNQLEKELQFLRRSYKRVLLDIQHMLPVELDGIDDVDAEPMSALRQASARLIETSSALDAMVKTVARLENK